MSRRSVRRTVFGSLVALPLCGPAGGALAQAQPALSQGALGQQGERLQRQQEERVQQGQGVDRRLNGAQTTIQAPPPLAAAGAGGPCRQIDRIVIQGATLASAPRQAGWIKPYAGRCLNVAAVERLLSDITRDYVERGYVTSRVYILPQNLAAGVLDLRVVEGRVQAVRPGPGSEKSVNLSTALPIPKGALLNLRDFEQGLDQLNQLPSNHATMDIQPGEQPGESVVVIDNRPDKRWRLSGSVDDMGQTSTGRTQASVLASYDDLLGLNDSLSYTRTQSVPFPKAGGDSRSNSIVFGAPYGRFNALLGYSDSAYRSRVVDSAGTVINLSGATQNAFVQLQGLVWRDQVTRVNLTLGLTNKKNDNDIDGVHVAVSSRTLDVLDVRADYSRLLPSSGGLLKATLTFSRGLSIFGALKDGPGLSDAQPRAQFSRLSLNGIYNQPFTVLGQAMSLTSEFNGQTTDHGLYSSEQILLGSAYTVRGFYDQSLTADRGFYLRNTVSAPTRMTLIHGLVLGVRPYAGVDVGYGDSIERTAPSGVLAGAAAGLALDFAPFSLDISTAHSLARAGLKDERFTTFIRLSAGI